MKRNNKIKIHEDALSSRFVVDLKKDNGDVRVNMESQPHESFELKLEKLAELDYKKYFSNGRDKFNRALLNYKDCLFKFRAEAGVGMKNSFSKLTTKRREVKNDRQTVKRSFAFKQAKRLNVLNELAFVELIKFFWTGLKKSIKIMDKICYGIGWMVMFAIRLFYLIIKAVIVFVTAKLHIKNFGANSFKRIKEGTLKTKPYFKTKKNTYRLVKASTETKPPSPPFARRENTNPLNPPFEGGRWKGGVKPVCAFAVILFIIILPFKAFSYYKTIDGLKGKVLGASENALNNLISGGQAASNLDFNQADKNFSLASGNFLSARQQLDEINGLLFDLASVTPNKNLRLAGASKHALRAGELSALAGKNLSLALNSVVNYRSDNYEAGLSDLNAYGRVAAANLAELYGELEKININSVPNDFRNQFMLLKNKTKDLYSGFDQFLNIFGNLNILLGGDVAKRYLLVFQNNSELRASGGFIGSFALLDVAKGKIKRIEAPGGGSYDTDAGLKIKIKSPEPLRLIRPDWHFWDANWWPDWPLSANKLAWFYEKSDGSTVDGVIGLTPTVMERLLKVIGPVELKEYKIIIDEKNFWRITQEFAEEKPNVTKQPKKIIGDLMNKIIEETPKRLNKDNMFDFFKAFEESLADKNALLYFSDPNLQAKAEEYGWSGEIKDTTGDYLSVINTNIAGGKSDRSIIQELKHAAEVQPDGTIIDTLVISRSHQAIKREPFSGVRNVDWMRIYVPLGSKLISADGFKPVDKIFFKEAEEEWQTDPDLDKAQATEMIDEESGTRVYEELNKTVFANWSQVDPGEKTEIVIKYVLPFKINNKIKNQAEGFLSKIYSQAKAIIDMDQKNIYSYSLLAQKQPGMNSSVLTSELKLSPNFKIIWSQNEAPKQNGWLITENFNEDKIMAVVMEKI